MWKIALAFVAFAALAMFMLSKGGNIDMGGEQHGTEVPPASEVQKKVEAPADKQAPAMADGAAKKP